MSNPDREPPPDPLASWQRYCQNCETRYQEWKENQLENEVRTRQDQKLKAQQEVRQDRDQQRRRLIEDQQARQNEHRLRRDQRNGAEAEDPSKQKEVFQRVLYDRAQQKISAELRSISEAKQGLDRHDFYNMETARELEAAMDRAQAQGINLNHEKRFQRFLEREAQQGLYQTEGKRPLADRYRELRDRRREAVAAMRRGDRDEISTMKLYESTWEQQYRLNQERKIFEENREWAESIDAKQAQWRKTGVSSVRSRLAEIRTQSPQTQERTSAREKLDQIRSQFGIDDNRDSQTHSKGRSR